MPHVAIGVRCLPKQHRTVAGMHIPWQGVVLWQLIVELVNRRLVVGEEEETNALEVRHCRIANSPLCLALSDSSFKS